MVCWRTSLLALAALADAHRDNVRHLVIAPLPSQVIEKARRAKLARQQAHQDDFGNRNILPGRQAFNSIPMFPRLGLSFCVFHLCVPVILALGACWLLRVDRLRLEEQEKEPPSEQRPLQKQRQQQPRQTHQQNLLNPQQGRNSIAQESRRPAASSAFSSHEGVSLNFTDDELERRWNKASLTSSIQTGAKFLTAVVAALLAHVVYKRFTLRAFQEPCDKPAWYHYVQVGVLAVILLGLILMLNLRPAESMYVELFASVSVYLLVSRLPPLEESCAAKLQMCRHRDDVVMEDCSLQGRTSMQLIISWLLLLPWILPRLSDFVIYATVWLFVGYLGFTFVYRYSTQDMYYDWDQVISSVLILSLASMISCLKKYYLEKGQRSKFLTDMKLRHTCERLFNIFEQMMPHHIIHDMIQNPNNAFGESYDMVSILFILIADFNAEERTPEQLLGLLNEQFSKIDSILNTFGVTKVETVGEEYVCCVGVTPKDAEFASKRGGHGVLLGRLVQAASQILEQPDNPVKFKMGIHTGPIVAGVIGNKLPRYRLFGDTINTAARMMQKSRPGELQYGEQTFSQLPATVKSNYKGEVQMKGKGMLKVWSFDAMVECTENKASKLSDFLTKSSDFFLRGRVEDSETFDEMVKKFGVSDDMSNRSFVSKLSTLSGGLILSEAQGFTQEMETGWLHHTHVHGVLKKLSVRLDRQALALCMLTFFEVGFLVWIARKLEEREDNGELGAAAYPGLLQLDLKSRFEVVIACRVICFVVLMMLRFLVITPQLKASIIANPKSQQAVFVVAYSSIAVTMFYSYDMLAFSDEDGGGTAFAQVALRRSPRDQGFLLVFVLVYHYITMQFTTYTITAVFYLFLLIYLTFGTSHFTQFLGRMTFQTEGKVLFIVNVLLTCFVAHTAEQTSRGRWKARRKVQMMEERIECILNKLMPPQVVEELRVLPPNLPPPSHSYAHATIAQADLCGFTKLSASRTPSEVVTFIGELFGAFDALTDRYGIYKVETVGDAYIAGMAEHTLTSRNSPADVTAFGLDMIQAVVKWSRNLGGDPVSCRVGIHHGACIGGIVGTGMQRYHLFGAMMTGVEVLESTAPEGQVQVSTALKAAVEAKGYGAPQLDSKLFHFVKRESEALTTSKGEVHQYSEVDGQTYLVEPHT